MTFKDAENLLPSSPGRGPITESEIRALEEMEDERLRRLGIDPDSDPIEIMMQIRRLNRELERKRKPGPLRKPGASSRPGDR